MRKLQLMWWAFVAAGLFIGALVAAPLTRHWLRARAVVRAAEPDADFDITELLALRERGEIDEATFIRLRERFERRRCEEGLLAQPRHFSPLIAQSAPAPDERSSEGEAE